MSRAESTRRNAKDKLRAGFLTQAVRQMREMTALVATDHVDADVAETVAHELEKMGEAAVSFGEEALRKAANVAARRIRAGAGRAGLAPLARALRAKIPRTRFPSVALIAVDPLASRLMAEASRSCEPIRVYSSVDAWRDDVHLSTLQALVLPTAALDELRDEDRDLPIFVYGPDDMIARKAVSGTGVAAFLPERVKFRQLVDLIRASTYMAQAPPPRLLLVGDEAVRTALGDALGDIVVVPGDGSNLMRDLREATPDLLVLADASTAAELARVLRGHPRYGDLTVAVLASNAKAPVLLEAGADLVFDAGAPPDELARRIRAAVVRARARRSGRDPATGLYDRAALLCLVDFEFARARRGGKVLAAAVIELDGLEEAERARGRSIGDYALRVLGRCIESAVRASDLTGRLGGTSVLVMLPVCSTEQAMLRLVDIQERFAALAKRDPRLTGIAFSAGIADSEDGLERLLMRAEASLERVRGKNKPGVIGT